MKKMKKNNILDIMLLAALLALIAAYFILPSTEAKKFDFSSDANAIDSAQAKAILENESVYRDFTAINNFDFELEKISAWDVYLHRNFELRDDWSAVPVKGLYKARAVGREMSLHAIIDSDEMNVVEIYTIIEVGK